MVSPTATPEDVRLGGSDGGVIAVSDSLSDSDIQGYIDDAAYEASNEIQGYSGWDAEDKRQLEKYYAAYLIRTLADKAVQSTSRETASVQYEGATIPELKAKVNARDPSGQLTARHDTSRYVGST